MICSSSPLVTDVSMVHSSHVGFPCELNEFWNIWKHQLISTVFCLSYYLRSFNSHDTSDGLFWYFADDLSKYVVNNVNMSFTFAIRCIEFMMEIGEEVVDLVTISIAKWLLPIDKIVIKLYRSWMIHFISITLKIGFKNEQNST